MWLILWIACRPPAGGGDSLEADDSSTDATDDTGGDDSGTDDSGETGDPLTGWVCDQERHFLEYFGLVGAWGDDAYAVALDTSGTVIEWSGETWTPIDQLYNGGTGLGGGPDGTVWALGYPHESALVREDGVWRREVPPETENVTDVWVTAADDVAVLHDSRMMCDDCTGSEVALSRWDGTAWTTIPDPEVWVGSATSLARLADGRFLVVGGAGARLVDGDAWSWVDLGGVKEGLADLVVRSDGTVMAVGNGGLVLEGNPDEGLERVDTASTVDLVAVHVDDSGTTWMLGHDDTMETQEAQLFEWTGAELVAVGAVGAFEVLAESPSGDLLVGGGYGGAALYEGAPPVEVWSMLGIAPMLDLAAAPDGLVYGQGMASWGTFGIYDGGVWRGENMGDIRSLVRVEAPRADEILFGTDDQNNWMWNGESGAEEPLVPPAGASIAMAATEDFAISLGGGVYLRGEGTWEQIDMSDLPPNHGLYDVAIHDGVAYFAGNASGSGGFIASWDPEGGAAVVLSGLGEDVPIRLWIREDGGLWAWLQYGPSRGLHRIEGKVVTQELEVSGIWSVVEHPVLGTVASVDYDEDSATPGPALMVRAADGTWSPFPGWAEYAAVLAVGADESLVIGTSWGAAHLTNCAFH